jgi:hypothetical protein
MNVYYTNPFYMLLPNEIQNLICSFLPKHPIVDNNYCISCRKFYSCKMNSYQTRDLDDSTICRHWFCYYCLYDICVYELDELCPICCESIEPLLDIFLESDDDESIF